MSSVATTAGPETPVYAHTQRGWVGLVILGVFAAVFIGIMLTVSMTQPERKTALLVLIPVLFLLVGILVVFSSLTVRVTREAVDWSFGPGAFGGRIALAQIQSATPTRTPFWAGLGIHWIGRGWVYNISGRGAVLIVERGGKTTWVGSDEPEALAAAIERARGG